VFAAGVTTLQAISPTGKTLWTSPLVRTGGHALSTQPSIAVDAAGHAYIGESDGTIRAFSAMGALLWTLHIPSPVAYRAPSLALSADGRLVVAGTDGLLRVYR
jgi:outer membrane protein assembly factor BamB